MEIYSIVRKRHKGNQSYETTSGAKHSFVFTRAFPLSLFYWHHFHSDQTYKIILVSTPQPLVGRSWAVKYLCRGRGWYHLCSCQLSVGVAVAALNFFSVLFQPSQELVSDFTSGTFPFSLNTGFPASWTDYQSNFVKIPTYIWKQLV